MREAHFGTIDSTIAGRFEDGEERCKIGIEYHAIDEILANG